MDYLVHFNDVCDRLEATGVVLNDIAIEQLRRGIEVTYKQGVKAGTMILKQEELDVHKAVKLQRVMNRYGAKK